MRRLIFVILPAILAGLLAISAVDAADGDVSGSHDYPGIQRFAGSVITAYDANEHRATRLQTAPFVNGDATGDLRPEGRVTRIAYRTEAGPTIADVARHFESELARAGYEPVFTCEAEACGGIVFSMGVDVQFIPHMWVDGVNYHYFVARKTGRGRDETWATLLVSHHLRPITVQLIVTQVGASRP